MSGIRSGRPADDNAGWVALLPAPRAADCVLCLELAPVRYAEGAAFWFDDVTALSAGVEARNAWRMRERVKEWLLGPTLQRWFAPVYGAVAWRGAARATLLESLPAMAGSSFAALVQLIVNPGKCFITGAAPAGTTPLLTVV